MSLFQKSFEKKYHSELNLSEKQYMYANGLLEGEEVTDYKEVNAEIIGFCNELGIVPPFKVEG